MLTLSDFGITPNAVTLFAVLAPAAVCITCAVGILLTCLFGIGLYRKALGRGEKNPYYAFLPLLRYYTLGRMAPGSEKVKKIFACLLPSVAIGAFVSAVITGAIIFKVAAAMIFAAEEAGGAIQLATLKTFPFEYAIAAVVITDVLSIALRLLCAVSVYGAFEEAGKKQIAYGVLSFLITPLAPILLYVTTKPAKAAKEAEAAPAEPQAEKE